jgi:hypothetical protein
MKKLSTSILTLLLVFTLAGTGYATNAPSKNPADPTTPMTASESAVLLSRLNEIKEMDKSDLSSKEKKALRHEVKAIKKSLSGGVYLSVGAVIIIILLLILLV